MNLGQLKDRLSELENNSARVLVKIEDKEIYCEISNIGTDSEGDHLIEVEML